MSSGPIRNQIQGPLAKYEESITVRVAWNSWNYGGWPLSFVLPDCILNLMRRTPFLPASYEPDRPIWSAKPSDLCTISSCLKIISYGTLPIFSWSWIWKLHVPPKIALFAWLVADQKLHTNEALSKFLPSHCNHCHVCGLAPETFNHLFRLCSQLNIFRSFLDSSPELYPSSNIQFSAWLFGRVTGKPALLLLLVYLEEKK